MGLFDMESLNCGIAVDSLSTGTSIYSFGTENEKPASDMSSMDSADIGVVEDIISAEVEENKIGESQTMSVKRPTIESVLSRFKSGIGLDIAPNHTGVALWRDGKLTTSGFLVDMEYDKDGYMAEAKMRKCFKDKMREILQGYDWEVCIIEDVYGGKNFSTTRKLIALNCVVDELVLEGDISIQNLYRFAEAEWMKDLRMIQKIGNKLNPKYECEQILKYLGFDLVLQEESSSPTRKANIFYEDRCDATGQLLSLAMHLISDVREVKSSSVRLSDVRMYFLEDLYEHPDVNDPVLDAYCPTFCDEFSVSSFEDSIINCLKKAKCLYAVCLETSQLGTFGIKNGFKYYEQGYGYLVFYDKSLRRNL